MNAWDGKVRFANPFRYFVNPRAQTAPRADYCCYADMNRYLSHIGDATTWQTLGQLLIKNVLSIISKQYVKVYFATLEVR